MKNLVVLILACVMTLGLTGYARADAARDATREQVRTTLTTYGPQDSGITFHQSEKQPFNFAGTLDTNLRNAQSMEVVVSISDKQTIRFSVYPHYGGRYINVGRALHAPALMKQLLQFNDTNFLYWGADDTSDVFAAYEFTLESGYPEAAIRIVLQSIPLLDQFVGQMRPNVDGTRGS